MGDFHFICLSRYLCYHLTMTCQLTEKGDSLRIGKYIVICISKITYKLTFVFERKRIVNFIRKCLIIRSSKYNFSHKQQSIYEKLITYLLGRYLIILKFYYKTFG